MRLSALLPSSATVAAAVALAAGSLVVAAPLAAAAGTTAQPGQTVTAPAAGAGTDDMTW
ncbi:hypothetical protein [Streptomyces sp. NPDC101132]|uniref:hypothetical protein n=1 Tax=Streptomyces sp. NPDC101132 TaxID=3366110 RepID=UPI0037F878FF